MSNKAQYGGGAIAQAGQFDITVKRLSNNLEQPLPFAIFGAADLPAGYQNVIRVPNGLTLTVTEGLQNSPDYDSVKLSFTDGALTDIIEITSPTVSYPSLIAASMVDLLHYFTIKMTLSLSDFTQFNQVLNFRDVDIFGGFSSKNITPSSEKKESQFQDNQVNLPIEGSIDKETSVTGNFVAQTGEIQFSFFFSRYMRYNAAMLNR